MTRKMPAIMAKHPPKYPLDTLEALVQYWTTIFGENGPEKHRRDTVVQYCSQSPSLNVAIRRACASRNRSGKMHNHQSRVTEKARKALALSLIKPTMRPMSFDSLFDTIEQRAKEIEGIGPVTIYDVATRIAAYMQLEIKSLYLHAGVRIGWTVLHGCRAPNVTRLEPDRWPIALRKLPADEVEDMLCAFRDLLHPGLLNGGLE